MDDKIKNKLKNLISKDISDWKEKARYRKENEFWLRHSQNIAIKILSELKRLNMTQKALAEKLNIEPQQINKIVKGQENLTLKTICQIEIALGVDLVTINEDNISLNNGVISMQKAVVEFFVSARVVEQAPLKSALSANIYAVNFEKANNFSVQSDNNLYSEVA